MSSPTASSSDSETADFCPPIPPRYAPVAPSNKADGSHVSKLNAKDAKSDDLWAIRLPAELKMKHLSQLKLDLSALDTQGSPSSDPCKVGELKAGKVQYEVFAECLTSTDSSSVRSSSRAKRLTTSSPEAGEISELVPLIPNRRTNSETTHLVIASGKISRVIFFRRTCPENPAPSAAAASSSIISKKCAVSLPAAKRPQPPDLEYRYVPYGAETDGYQYKKAKQSINPRQQ